MDEPKQTAQMSTPACINDTVKAEIQPDGTYILKLNQIQYLMIKNIIEKYNKHLDASRELMRKKRGSTKEFTPKGLSVRINIE